MRGTFAFLLLLSSIVVPASSAASPDAAEVGARPPGLEVGAEVVLDAVSSLRGAGERESALLGKSSLSLELDLERAGLLRGATVRLSVLGTFGDDPSDFVGDIQALNNIAAPGDVGVLEAWMEKRFGERLSVLAGYHDFNTEFDVVESAAELLNSSFGIGPEISQFGPSIFPSTHPGLRIRLDSSPSTYVQFAGYDGLNVEGPDETMNDRRMFALEAGWMPRDDGRGTSSKVAMGVWSLPVSGGGGPGDETLSGAYLLAEHTMTRAGGRSIGIFARVGGMSDERHPVEGYAGFGVRVGAPFESRPGDVISLGVARADLSPARQIAVGANAARRLRPSAGAMPSSVPCASCSTSSRGGRRDNRPWKKLQSSPRSTGSAR